MNGFFNRIDLMISRYLSNRLLMREQGILLAAMACMMAAASFSNVFVNIFLYTKIQNNLFLSDGIYVVAKYNMLSAVYMLLFCFIISITAKKLTYRVSMAIGAVAHIIFYIILIALRADIQSYIGLIALLSGLGTSFFYISYNSLVNVMISGASKKQYIMFQSIISITLGIIIPIIAGAVIMSGVTVGYTIVFAMCAFLSGGCMCLCCMLPKVRGLAKKNYFAGVFIKSFLDKRYFAVSVLDIFRGLKEGVIAFFIPLILIKLSASTLIIGLYIAMCAALGVAVNFFSNKAKFAVYPYMAAVFATVFITASAIMLVFKINIWSVFLFGAVNALATSALFAPQHLTYYNALTQIGGLSKKTLETTSVKEIYFNLGKILSILIFGATMKNTSVTMAVIAMIFALQFICWGICVANRADLG